MTTRVVFENLLSVGIGGQYPNHTLVANEEATGFEVSRLANGRRSRGDYWTPTTANNRATVTCTFDRVRCFDTIILDRGHTLGGFAFDVAISSDSFTTSETVFDQTLPAASSPGRDTNTLGVRTEEGAWLHRLSTPRATEAVRAGIDAMGAGVRPRIVGLVIGLSVDLGDLDRPWVDDQADLQALEGSSQTHWVGRGIVSSTRAGELLVRQLSYPAYDTLRLWLAFYGRGHIAWLIPDTDQADRAFAVTLPVGRLGLPFPTDWAYRAGAIPYREHEPLIA